ncbi:MAG: S8 family serine peptidase [Anaerolineae bacterium]
MKKPPWLFLCVIGLLAASYRPVQTVAKPPLQAEVSPLVWKTLEQESQAEVLVVLREQADLSDAASLPTKEAKGRYVYERLRAVAETGQRSLRTLLDAQQAEYQSFYIVNALKVRANRNLVSALAARPEVARIELNPSVQALPEPVLRPEKSLAPWGIEGNLARVHAPEVWALGYTGQGIVVAGQDTGYDWDHPALIRQYRGWAGATASHDYHWHDAIHQNDPHILPGNPCGFDSPVPCDDDGHGTHTMGILVGDDGMDHQIGMAPGARWIGCRNMEQGRGTPASYIECFEFFLAPYPVGGTPDEGDPSLAPHVISNSWSCPPDEGCGPATLEAVVKAVRQAGIAVVVSAGNYGPQCKSVFYPPAIYRESLAVGAFDHQTDVLLGLSSRGPVTYNGQTYLKPDIAAPGVDIYSSLPNGLYGFRTGTSMAAPHVAGAVALFLSAAPDYAGQVDAIETILTRTAEPKPDTTCGEAGPPNNVWGWGIVDVLAAVRAVSLLRGTVTEADSSVPLAGVRVAVDREIAPVAVTNAAGAYTLTLAIDTYTVTADTTGYLPQTVTNVVVTREAVTTLDFALAPALSWYLPLSVKNR